MATKKTTKKTIKKNARYVVLRSNMSGVWMGRFVTRDGDEVTIDEATKLWRWRVENGGRTTAGLAVHGAAVEHTRAERCGTATVFGVCEILDATDDAVANTARTGWAS